MILLRYCFVPTSILFGEVITFISPFVIPSVIALQMKMKPLVTLCFALLVFCLLDTAQSHPHRFRPGPPGRRRPFLPRPIGDPQDHTWEPQDRTGRPPFGWPPWRRRRPFPPGGRPPRPTGDPEDHTWDPEDHTGKPPFGWPPRRRPRPPPDGGRGPPFGRRPRGPRPRRPQ